MTARSGRLANPFLYCLECRARVEEFDLGPGVPVNLPCGHAGGYGNPCPSWGPVDGCCCLEQLGEVPHGQAQPAKLQTGWEGEQHTTTWHCPVPGDGQVFQVVRDQWSFPDGYGQRPHRDIYEVHVVTHDDDVVTVHRGP